MTEEQKEQKALEDQFLIAEYNQCWQTISAIDERRGKFLQSITTIVVAAIGAVGFLIDGQRPTLSKTMEATAILLLTLFAMVFVVRILLEERKANVRRRKWVNAIRETLLAGSKNSAIQEYLQKYKDLGVKISTDEEPHGIGSTLGKMFLFLGIEAAALLVALGYIWARYSGFISQQ